MSIQNIDGLWTLTLDVYATVALCAFIAFLSYRVFGKMKFIQKYCLPPIVVGGFAYSVVYSLLTATGIATIVTDQTLLDPLFIIFFTSVGFTTVINKKLIQSAGKIFFILFIAEGIWLAVQTFWALFVGGKVLGMPYPVAFLTGTITMAGGIPGGVAWGTKAQELGFTGAVGIGLACGAIGQLMGGFISAPFTRKFFIKKYNLRSIDDLMEVAATNEVATTEEAPKKEWSLNRMMKQIAVFGIVVPVGLILRDLFMEATGFFMLDFVCAMILAIIIVNVDQKVKVFEIDQEFMSKFGNIILQLYIAMSFLTLNLADLKDLIGPALIVMAIQAVSIMLYVTLLFRLMGKTYNAAMLLAGFMGHGLGNTTTAFASLDTLQKEFGPCKLAFIITPLIGACLIDIFGIPIESTGWNLALMFQGLA